MKNKIDYNICPICKSKVFGMKCGSANIFGCIKCKNAQGMHFKMKAAKSAWKIYVDKFLTRILDSNK